jgi:purine nucleosidase
MSERIPILFDTDIGSDIDDAVALAYLLRHPECELVGVTTVSGEPVERARLADAVCQAAGRADVPIHAGAGLPFLGPSRQPHAPQKSVLPRWPHRADFPPNTAVPFLQQAIRARPGEITLLAVGPLTNVGVLLAMDPELPSLLKRLVLMGGTFSSRTPFAARTEWNILNDPYAAARVFAAPVPEFAAFGLDVTLTCTLPAADCRQRLRGGPLDVVADMAEVWFHRAEQITFHDPLAAVAVFHPDVCRYERGRAEVELTSPRVPGMTHWSPDEQGPHHVAMEVEADRFFQHYFAVFE